jgi:osmoprotectant transport system permease protein
VTLLASETGPKCYSRLVNDWVCGDYLVDRQDEIVAATLQHLGLTLGAVALGLGIALPMALLARRHPRLENGVLAFSTGLYTIPSLALFPLLLPFTGLSAATVVIGLALYALTILVRAFLDGFGSVPADVVESATGLGYSRWRLLRRIELPLALPVIMAGLRVATVSTVALTTVGALVSYGGLGNLLVTGVAQSFRAQILTASVLCVLIALLFDALLVLAQRVLTPWTRAGGGA